MADKQQEMFVIPTRRIPVNPVKVLLLAALVWLYLDRFHAPIWLLGALGMLLFILLAAVCLRAHQQKERDILFQTYEEYKPYNKFWNRGKMG